jgi:long-chain acyl-CoA synthetase
LILALYSLQKGTTLLLLARWTPNSLSKALLTYPVSVLPLVPTLFGLLLQGLGGQKPPRLKYCISGGAGLPASLLHHVEAAMGCPVLEGYGLTETSPVVAVNRPDRGSFAGSVGHVLHNVQVGLLADDDQTWLPMVEGEASPSGEICIKADSVMMGYYRDPDQTTATMTTDGWFKTGDLGHLDAEGRLVISGGRKKDLIIKAGENIAPVRIEHVFYQHPLVQEACVFGVPDDRAGEEIMAAVVLKPTDSEADPSVEAAAAATEKALKQFCQQQLPSHMVPKRIHLLTALPKNAVGKVVKAEVAKVCQALVAGPSIPTAV